MQQCHKYPNKSKYNFWGIYVLQENSNEFGWKNIIVYICRSTEIEKIDNTWQCVIRKVWAFSYHFIYKWGYIFSYILFLYIILISVIDADLSCMRVKLQSWAMLRTAEKKILYQKFSAKSNTSQTKKKGSQNKLKAIQKTLKQVVHMMRWEKSRELEFTKISAN